MKTITINSSNLNAVAPLYTVYAGQLQPQPSYIQLNNDGSVSADYSGEIGNAKPASVWHNVDLRYPVNPAVSGKALREFLSGDGKLLLERIHAGHDTEWNGDNLVGILTDDARQAEAELESAIEDLELAEVWTAKDWLFSSCNLAEVWSGKPLADAVAELELAVDSNCHLEGSIQEVLLEAAENEFDEDGDDHLDAYHLAALVECGCITQEQAAARNA